jgi:hypothetical protein
MYVDRCDIYHASAFKPFSSIHLGPWFIIKENRDPSIIGITNIEEGKLVATGVSTRVPSLPSQLF